MLQGLDVEAQRGRDSVDVLAVELLENGRLARVVQTPMGERGRTHSSKWPYRGYV